MKGATVLVGGEPGIGKSTLMLQLAGTTKTQGRLLYVSGEESSGQLKMRADRLGIERSTLEVLCETDLSSILVTLNAIKPVVVIIDSIQTLLVDSLGSVPGTIAQIKYACHEIMSWARQRGSCVFLVAHVTKDGTIAGPKVIEHMVDTVLYFDQTDSQLRILRAAKNRFGSVDEIGLFTMSASGLDQLKDPSSLFMIERHGEMPPGVIVTPVFEGSRVLMVELQALVVPAKGGISRVFSDRVDPRRVSRVAAVMEKHQKLRFSDQDLYVNIAGGIRIHEVGIDLPLALALYSARTSISIPAGISAAGEITLAGEIRPIAHIDRRIKAAADLGYAGFIGPVSTETGERSWTAVRTVEGAIRESFGPKSR